MTISPALRLAYAAHRASRMARTLAYGREMSAGHHDGYNRAALDLTAARRDVAAGRALSAPRPSYLGHGSVIRSRTASGERRTYVVAIMPDSSMGAPWEAHDGHGVIRETGRDHRKAPGEVLMTSGDDMTYYAYDVPASHALARKDGWGLRPDHAEALERRLGRKPTAREVTAEAVRLDLERCREWLNDDWSWIGVALIEMPRDEERDPETLADAWASGMGRITAGRIAASLWGIESDSPDYHHTVALELVSEANAA